jgi:DNA polymerase IV
LAQDEIDPEVLAHALWPLCDRVSGHLKEASLAAGSVTLKLKTGDFRLRIRSRHLADPTQLAETLLRVASALLASEADGVTPYRLNRRRCPTLLVDGTEADLPTLFDDELGRPRRLEQTIDEIRGRLGNDSVRRGRDLARLGVRSAAEVAPHAVPRERE